MRQAKQKDRPLMELKQLALAQTLPDCGRVAQIQPPRRATAKRHPSTLRRSHMGVIATLLALVTLVTPLTQARSLLDSKATKFEVITSSSKGIPPLETTKYETRDVIFDYWTLNCPRYEDSTFDYPNKSYFTREIGGSRAYMKFRYEFEYDQDTKIDTIFLLFHNSMMSSADSSIMENIEVEIEGDDGNKQIWDSVGSGFFKLDQSFETKSLEVTIYNTDTDAKTIHVAGIHLYGTQNVFQEIQNSRLQSDANNKWPSFIPQTMPSKNFRQNTYDFNSCADLQNGSDLIIDLGSKKYLTDFLLVAEGSDQSYDMGTCASVQTHNFESPECADISETFLSGLSIYFTDTDTFSTDANILTDLKKQRKTGTEEDSAPATGMNWKYSARNMTVSKIKLVAGDDCFIRICHMGIFYVDYFSPTIDPVEDQAAPTDGGALVVVVPVSFTQDINEVKIFETSPCFFDNESQERYSGRLQCSQAIKDSTIEMTVTVQAGYDWDAHFAAYPKKSTDINVFAKFQGKEDFDFQDTPAIITVSQKDQGVQFSTYSDDLWVSLSEETTLFLDPPVFDNDPNDIKFSLWDSFTVNRVDFDSGLAVWMQISTSEATGTLLTVNAGSVYMSSAPWQTLSQGDKIEVTIQTEYQQNDGGSWTTETSSISLRAGDNNEGFKDKLEDFKNKNDRQYKIDEPWKDYYEEVYYKEVDYEEVEYEAAEGSYGGQLGDECGGGFYGEGDQKDGYDDYMGKLEDSINKQDTHNDPGSCEVYGMEFEFGLGEKDFDDLDFDALDDFMEDHGDNYDKGKLAEKILDKKVQIVQKRFDSKLLATLRDRVPTFAPKFYDQRIETIDEVDEVEPVKIEPKISKLSAAGEITVQFDPPSASVPESWDALFDPVARAEMTENELKYFESVISEVFTVSFVQNSDEEPQSFFEQSVAQFTPAGLKIQLDFGDPLLVSQGEEPDLVKIKLLKSFFTQTDSRRRLQTDSEESLYHEFTYEVPKQVKSKEELLSLEKTTEAATQLIAGQFVTSLILNIVLSGTLSQLWNIFNTMQLLTALPMFAINTPGNVLTINDKFSEISNFKIVEKEQLYDWIIVPVFGTETSEYKAIEAGVITVPETSTSEGQEGAQVEKKDTEVESQIEEDETKEDEEVNESYLTSIFAGTTLVMNILLVILALIFFACMITLLILCRRCINTKCCNCVKTIFRKIEAKLMFNSILRAALESYFLVSITTLYGLANSKFGSSEEYVTFGIGIVTVTYLVLFPILQYRFLLKKHATLGEDFVKEKYGSLYTNVLHEKRHALRFTLYFCMRRFAFALTICFLKESLVLQILAADMAILGMLAFYVGGLPMTDKANNFIQIFNEIVVCLCIISLVIFTDFIPSPVDRYDYGYILLYVIASSISVNVLILLATIAMSIYKAIRKMVLKRRQTKQMQALVEKRALGAVAARQKKHKKIVLVELEDIVEEQDDDLSSSSDEEESSVQQSSQSSYQSVKSIDGQVDQRSQMCKTDQLSVFSHTVRIPPKIYQGQDQQRSEPTPSAQFDNKKLSVLDDGSLAMLEQMGIVAVAPIKPAQIQEETKVAQKNTQIKPSTIEEKQQKQREILMVQDQADIDSRKSRRGLINQLLSKTKKSIFKN